MANLRITPAPVRKSITVNASQARAFEAFTARMIRWRRPDHHIGTSPMKDVVLEPKVGGGWYEVGEDGTVCEWGKVLEWDPPRRFVLAWQLGADWKYDPDFMTVLEVRFAAAEGSATRVELEHRDLERYGERVAEVRASLDAPGGWTGALAAYAAEVGREG